MDQYKELYESILKDVELVNKDLQMKEKQISELQAENEKLRRKNYGLETTVENLKRKEERMYEKFIGEVKDA